MKHTHLAYPGNEKEISTNEEIFDMLISVQNK